uniref:TLC domain-containing protein n=1 Tax=Compsopogon caeruleus TaxID=31354 RepID=A0A7S1TAC8_9RHOD
MEVPDESLMVSPIPLSSLVITRESVWDALMFALMWELVNRVSRVGIQKMVEVLKVSERYRGSLIATGPSYMTSVIHSLVMTYRGYRDLWGIWPSPPVVQMCGSKANVPWEVIAPYAGTLEGIYLTARIFFGYMLYDTAHVIVEFPQLGGMDMVLHHVVFMGGIYLGIVSRAMYFPFTWLISTELSTIFLNLRWFCAKSGYGEGKEIAVVSYLFAAAFLFSRVLLFGYGLVHFWMHRAALSVCSTAFLYPATRFIVTGGYFLNVFWFGKILQVAARGGARKSMEHDHTKEAADAKSK